MKTKTSPTAIVTGSSRGIGAAIAKQLASDGFNIVIDFSGRHTDANQVVRDIETAGGQATAVQADVAEPAEVAALFGQAEEHFGGVNVLVNNAGLLKLSPLAETEDAHFDRLIAVNLKGAFNTMRVAAKRLRPGGRVINLSTSVIGMALPNYGVYAATKSAVETMTRIFAQELRGTGITVNAVAPGPTATDLFFEGKSKAFINKLAKMPPLERLGTPEDIAKVVSFLAGPDSGWINGQVLRANGGIV